VKESLCLVIPVYNEEECLQVVLESWHKTLLESLPEECFEIYVHDDGSTDGSLEILRQCEKKLSNLKVFTSANHGHGMALNNLYSKAVKGEFSHIFQTDSDQQIKSSEFKKLWNHKHESPFILGYRYQRKDPMIRKVLSRVLRIFLLTFFKIKALDVNIPFRLMTRQFLKEEIGHLPQNSRIPNVYLSILSSEKRQWPLNIPVEHLERETGNSVLQKYRLLIFCWHALNELMTWKLKDQDLCPEYYGGYI
jgi:dolichol-phosphate mannosyltransferase